jgi:hypothetical protein
MTSREQFLNDYEISHLVCDSDDSEDDRHGDDDIGLSGSEDEEDTVEEDLGNIDPMYDVADTCDHGEPENIDDEHSETGESTVEETNFFKARNLPGAGHLTNLLELTDRTQQCVLPCVWMKPKNANTPHDAFPLFISDDILNVILTHTNQKIRDYPFSFTGKVQKWVQRTSLDELCAVIVSLI